MAESQNAELRCETAHMSFSVVGSAVLLECHEAFSGCMNSLVTTHQRSNCKSTSNCLTCAHLCHLDTIFRLHALN